MGETRAGKYGRNLALFVGFVAGADDNYMTRFISELKKYSFERRKKGEKRNSGCVYELDGLERVKIDNPEQLARLVKEGIHLLYQKNTAQKTFNALVDGLERKV